VAFNTQQIMLSIQFICSVIQLIRLTCSFNDRRPNGELISTTPDTFDIGGIIAPYVSGGIIVNGLGIQFPFNVNLANSQYSVLDNTNPYNFFINTTKYFSKFEMCEGDRIQIGGYTYPDDILNDVTYGETVRAFCNWINRPEGHIVLGSCYSVNDNVSDDSNNVGYANFIVIQARYYDPSTGSVSLNPFDNIAEVLNYIGTYNELPCRLINLNKQLNMVFRIITRDMDSLPQIRPDNNY
jgi:hypothetical protein